MYSYTNPPLGVQIPHDAASVRQTHAYLSACNNIFEKGFLSWHPISSPQSEGLQHIQQGYAFFVDWYDNLDRDIPDFSPKSPSEKRFLAWQTWDLLRICVYGFQAFCTDFLQRHPGYYVAPLKWNGSAVETLFSQIKRAAGGKLDSTNYATAREALLVRRDTHGHSASKAVHGYRDVPLYIREGQLNRR